MWLNAKKQANVISRVNERYQAWKDYWDGKIFKEFFADYRRMANGQLPQKIADRLKGDDYLYNSKLIPRLVPDAIQYLKAISSSSLFNRDLVFEFIGTRENDNEQAADANDLVADEFIRTDFRNTAEQLIEDALEVGICFQERRHWWDRRPVVKYGRDKLLRKKLIRNSFETIYEGPRAYRLRPEMVYLDPEARHPDDKPEYSKTMVLWISQIRKEADSLYKDFADNIPKIKPGDYDPTVRYEHDQVDDHKTNEDVRKDDEDFPVLYTEHWYRLQNPKTDIPVITCIGVVNYNKKPYMLRYDIDPMLTGESPLEIGRIYPRNDRMVGESVPEKVRAYLLAKFYARNTRIDLVNLARDITGILFMPGDIGDMDSMLTKRKRIIKIPGGASASEMKEIKLDLSAVPHLQFEEGIIDADAEKTLATNRIALGQTPSRRETATAISVVNENSQIMSNYPLRQIENSIIKPAARGYLLHSQLLMPEKFVVRTLGKYRSAVWKNRSRKDILGVFDTKCYGSSEILAKGVKQSLINSFVQTWSQIPGLRIDWQGLARVNMEMSEIPSADRYVPDVTWDVANAERENGMLLEGIVIRAIETDNHRVDIMEHLKIKDAAEAILNEAVKLQLPDDQVQEAGDILSNIEVHIQQHERFQQIIQGQINVGAGSQLPTSEDTSSLLRNVNSNLNTGVAG